MKKMYMIGNAHLDPVWLWPWQEGFQENKATCKSALERLGEYEDVIFTSSSAQFYEWIEKNDPEMFSEIEKRIREGRWLICGGWWVQPDCNIPCGESCFDSPELFYGKIRCNSQNRIQCGQLWSPGNDAADPAVVRHGELCIHAAGSS